MRLVAMAILALALVASTVAGAARVPGGSLEIKDGRGIVQIKGQGVLLGRVLRGSVQITDLSPGDEWSPWVNGVPRGKVVWIRGEDVSFRLLSGRYKIVARGDGISISARGSGQASLDGEPDTVGATGLFWTGDHSPQPLPPSPFRISFGMAEPAPSAASVRITP